MSQASTYPLGTSGTALGVNAGGTVQRFTLREVLTGNRTYYVATTGSDSNDGLSSGTPFLTIGRAMTAVAQVDFNGYQVTVSIANGTYAEAVAIPVTVGQKLISDFNIVGNTTTPTSVIVAPTGGYAACFSAQTGARAQIIGMRLTATNNGYGIQVAGGAVVFNQIDFGACGQMQVSVSAGTLTGTNGGTYTISGAARAHLYSTFGSITVDTMTCTVSNTPAFSIAFVYMSGGKLLYINSTIAGSATGSSYSADTYGTITTYGKGATFFPGNSAGTTSNGLYS